MTTVALLFSNKEYCVKPAIQNIKELILPRDKMRFLVIDVSGNPAVTRPLVKYMSEVEKDWKEIEYINSPQIDQITTEVPKAENPESFNRKRWLVAETKNLMNRYVKGDVFIIEEDTLCPPHSYEKLRATLDSHPRIGAVSGINYSRNNNSGKGKPTVWKFKLGFTYPAGEFLEETKIKMVAEKEIGLEQVAAGGLGCILVKADMLKHNFVGMSTVSNLWGSDVNFGYYVSIMREKYFMVDWSVKTKHLGEEQDKVVPYTSIPYGPNYDWKAN